jgi:hypothetical protein
MYKLYPVNRRYAMELLANLSRHSIRDRFGRFAKRSVFCPEDGPLSPIISFAADPPYPDSWVAWDEDCGLWLVFVHPPASSGHRSDARADWEGSVAF